MLVSVPVLPLVPWRIRELGVRRCHVSGACVAFYRPAAVILMGT